MRKVLVTGGTGFVGRHALPVLSKNGYQVHAVTRNFPIPTAKGNVTWHHGDLMKREEIESLLAKIKPSHLLHFAWYAIPGKYWTAAENLAWAAATLNLVQAFCAHGGNRAVVAGSCAEYDWNYGRCSETSTPCNPSTLYGACKNATRLVLEAWSKQADLSSAWGRIFFVYGPHESPSRLVPSVIDSLLKGQPARCTHGNQVRDFMHVADVASAFVALLNSEVTGSVNVASGVAVPLREVIYGVADALDQRKLIQLGTLAAPANEPQVLIADVGRLRDEVGFRPRFDLQDGISDTVAWAKENWK